MQFHLETDELNLLANVVLEQDPRQYNDLLNKVLARDLRFDSGELEQTTDLLARKKRRLQEEISRQPDNAPSGLVWGTRTTVFPSHSRGCAAP